MFATDGDDAAETEKNVASTLRALAFIFQRDDAGELNEEAVRQDDMEADDVEATEDALEEDEGVGADDEDEVFATHVEENCDDAAEAEKDTASVLEAKALIFQLAVVALCSSVCIPAWKHSRWMQRLSD